MAELNTNWSVPTVTPVSGVHDYATGWIQVGSQLNKQYYENQQKYLTNLVDPLSKVETNEWTQGVVNGVRSEISNRFKKYEETGDWHHANDDIFNTSRWVLNHEGLRKAMENNEQYKVFRKELKESDHNEEDQAAILKLARMASEELTYDANTNTTKGGFTPVAIGKAFDFEKFENEVYDRVSKIKADSSESTTPLSPIEAVKAYGLDVITGLDGQVLASHIVTMTQKWKGVTPDKIAKAVKGMLASSPTYIYALQKKFYYSYVNKHYDATTNKLTDIDISETHSTLGDLNVLALDQTLNNAKSTLSVKDFITLDPTTNKFILNNNTIDTKKDDAATKELKTKRKVQLEAWQSQGVDLLKIVNGEAELPTAYDVNSLANEFITNAYNQAKKTNNKLTEHDFYYNLLQQHYVNSHTSSMMGGLTNLYSFNEVSNTANFLANQHYNAAVDARYKMAIEAQKKQLEQGVEAANYQVEAVTSVRTTPQDHAQAIAQYNQVGESIAQVTNDNKEYRAILSSDDYKEYMQMLGLNISSDEDMKSVNLTDIRYKIFGNETSKDANEKSGLVGQGKMTSTEANSVYANISAYVKNLKDIDTLNGQLEAMQFDYNRLQEAYLSNKSKYTSAEVFGIGNRITELNAKMIMDNGLFTYEAYSNYYESLQKGKDRGVIFRRDQAKYTSKGYDPLEANKTGLVPKLSKEEFDEYLADVLTQVGNRYEEINGKSFEYTTTSHQVFTPSKYTKAWLEAQENAIGSGTGGWSVISTNGTGKIKKVTGKDIAVLANYSGNGIMYTSTTVNDKGESVTTRNTPVKDLEPFDASDFGFDGKCYRTKFYLGLDPTQAKNGKVSMFVDLMGKNGELLGKVQLTKDMDYATQCVTLLDEFAAAQHAYIMKDKDAARDMDNILSVATQTTFTFEGVNGSASPKSLAQLQSMVDTKGAQGVTVQVNIPVLTNPGAQPITRIMKFTKINGRYHVEDVDPRTKNGNQGVFTYQVGNQSVGAVRFKEYTNTSNRSYVDLVEALRPLCQWNMDTCNQLRNIFNNR